MTRKDSAAIKTHRQDDQNPELRDGEISEASADTALQEAEGLILPELGDLETEGATQAFGIPQTPPFMQEDEASDEDAPSQEEERK